MMRHNLLQASGRFHAALLSATSALLLVGAPCLREVHAQYVFEPTATNAGNWAGNNRWRIGGTLTGANFPNAADATATFNLPISTAPSATFTIGMTGAPTPPGTFTVGGITVNNTAGNAFDTQFGTTASPGSIVFQVTNGSASYTESAGSSTGGTTVRSTLTLLSNLIVTQDHVDSDNLNTGTTFSGLINGAAGIVFTKEGLSNLAMTNATAPTGTDGFFGSYVINHGAMRFTNDTLLATSSGVTVNSGGQLQIGGTATATVNLGTGTTLKLNGTGATGAPTNADGALRIQTASGVTTTIPNAIEVQTASNLNVSPSGAIALVTNVVSGAGGLTKTGAGTLELGGSQSNTFAGGMGSADSGQINLNKSGGAIAVPGNLNIGGTSLVIVQQDEQIADNSLVRFTSTTENGGTLRLGGFNRNETVGGILSTNGKSGTIESNNNTAGSVATFTVAGAFTSQFDGLIRDTGFAFVGKLALAKTGAESLTLTNANTYSGGTTLSGGSLLINNTTGSGTGTGAVAVNGGTLGGTGIISGTATVASGGHVAPGVGAGVLTVGGATFNSGSALDIEIGGTIFNPGTQVDFDRLAVDNAGAGTATLGGALNVSLINGFTPALNDAFHILTASTAVTGTFATTNLPALSPGNAWQVNYQPNYVELKVIAGSAGVLGDYNGNGVVDAADYVLWRNGGPLQNQVGGPGPVTQQDYVEWRARFGNTAGSGSSGGGLAGSSAVPEPTTAVFAVFALAGLLVSGRKR